MLGLAGADWRRGRVVDFGPRGPGFSPQPGRLSLWHLASLISKAQFRTFEVAKNFNIKG